MLYSVEEEFDRESYARKKIVSFHQSLNILDGISENFKGQMKVSNVSPPQDQKIEERNLVRVFFNEKKSLDENEKKRTNNSIQQAIWSWTCV